MFSKKLIKKISAGIMAATMLASCIPANADVHMRGWLTTGNGPTIRIQLLDNDLEDYAPTKTIVWGKTSPIAIFDGMGYMNLDVSALEEYQIAKINYKQAYKYFSTTDHSVYVAKTYKGDVNGDSFVDMNDFFALSDYLDAAGSRYDIYTNERFDFNGDGYVDYTDLGYLSDYLYWDDESEWVPRTPEYKAELDAVGFEKASFWAYDANIGVVGGKRYLMTDLFDGNEGFHSNVKISSASMTSGKVALK